MLRYDHQVLSIDSIELDKENPRIARILKQYPKITDEHIRLALCEVSGSSQDSSGPSFETLKNSILANRGVIHPIIVNKESSGKHVVIEGNTRLFIYRDFNKAKMPGDWSTIPALVYDDMDALTKDSIRLQAHLVGTREWDPYSKAKYLESLNKTLPMDQLVSFCGGNAKVPEIVKYIAAYNDMETYYRPVVEGKGVAFDPRKFSAFAELQQKRNINSLQKHGFTKTDFAEWVYQEKFHPINTVRYLERILDNEKSRDIFMSKDATDAIRYLETLINADTEIGDASLIELCKALIRKVNTINLEHVRKLQSMETSEEKDIIQNTSEELDYLIKQINQ